MNIKLNNDDRSNDFTDAEPISSAEERRRTGRYMAILVGISLICLAMYHAWIRRIPVLASLLVPALIMLLYIGWVLYTASRDKKKVFDPERGLESVIGLLPRPPLTSNNTEIIPADPPPSNSKAPSTSSTKTHSSADSKNRPVKKTTIVVPSTLKESDTKKTLPTTTPKNPNSPKEFRRCYSIT